MYVAIDRDAAESRMHAKQPDRQRHVRFELIAQIEARCLARIM
jgi:hypothetical protein